jgi:hypothetical protein
MLGVVNNDYDVEGAALTAVLDTGPAHGSLTFNADGTFAYVPEAGFIGVDTFRYHTTDGVLDSLPVVVRIGVGTGMPSEIVEDVNRDGMVSATDVASIVASYSQEVDSDEVFRRADLNRDGVINLIDAIRVRNAMSTLSSANQPAAVVASGATRGRAVASRRASVENRLSAVAVDEAVSPVASELGERRGLRRAMTR